MKFQLCLNLLGFESPPPQGGEDAVSPVVGGHVQRAEHLRGRDGLGVHPHLSVWRAALCHGLHQRVDAGGFPGAAGTQRHHPCMTTEQDVVLIHKPDTL